MNTQDFLSLQEAYMEVYNELDEAITSEKGKAKAAEMIAKRSTASGRAKPGQGGSVSQIKHISRSDKEGLGGTPATRSTSGKNYPKSYSGIGGTGNKAARRAGLTPTREKPNAWKEQVDIYDIILSHLLDEGYAETPEAAEVIMVNMSEDWRESIVDEAYQEPRFRKKDYIKKLSKRGGMGMGTPEDPHGYRDPKMAKVGAEFSKRKTAAAKAKKTGEPDTYRAEKEAQSKRR